MTHEYMVCKIADLKYEIRMEEIKYVQAFEDDNESVAAYYLKKINILKSSVNNLVANLNFVTRTETMPSPKA